MSHNVVANEFFHNLVCKIRLEQVMEVVASSVPFREDGKATRIPKPYRG